MQLSVIICTCNPVEKIFQHCLTAICVAAKQSAPAEILIIDNNSTIPVENLDYVKKILQQNASIKIIREKKQGLTPARLRGIQEASGELLVFIDDDNFIEPDFFKVGNLIADNYPHIGAYSGQVKLMFEEKPEEALMKYRGLLVWREFSEDKWSNLPHLTDTMPCGAGLFIRKNAALHYLHLHETGKRPIQLDRNGNSFFSAGDNDMAACACDIGMGVGIFSSLVVNHFIPASRISKDYLLKLANGIAASTVVFKSFRGEMPAKKTAKRKLADKIRLLLKSKTDRQFYKAVLNGEKTGAEILGK